MPTTSRPARLILAAAIAALAAGCVPGYYPGGPLASYDLFTYESTMACPKNVYLLDTSTNTTIWSVEIPVGKQLVIRFYDDFDTKNPTRPTLMRWEIFDNGTTFGELHNSIPAPGRDRRRVDWEIRKHPAAAPPPEPAAAPGKGS